MAANIDPNDLQQRCFALYDIQITRMENGEELASREFMITLENMVRTLGMSIKEQRYAAIAEGLEELDIEETQQLMREVSKYIAEPSNVDRFAKKQSK